MPFTITVNSDQVVKALSNTAENMPQILSACVMSAVDILYAESKHQMDVLIYNKPIPNRKNGKPMWVRTSNLLNNEQNQVLINAHGAAGRVYNSAGYQYSRHESNGPWRHGDRTAHWHDVTIQNKGQAAMDVFVGQFDTELTGRGL